MARVALHPKVHMVETDSLFPIQSWYGEVPSGSVEWGATFLMRVAWCIAYGQVVHPTVDLMDSSRAILIITRVWLMDSATPFSCGVSRLVFSWTIPEDFKN